MNIYAPLEEALHIPWVLQAAVLTTLLLVGAGLVVRRQIAAAGGGVVPDEGVTLRNVVEVIVDHRDVPGELGGGPALVRVGAIIRQDPHDALMGPVGPLDRGLRQQRLEAHGLNSSTRRRIMPAI